MDTPFAELSPAGRARRLRPLAEQALAAHDLAWTDLHLLSNDWNCTFRVDTPAGPKALRIMRCDTSIARTKVPAEVEFVDALLSETDLDAPRVLPNRAGDLFTVCSVDQVPQPQACVLFEWLSGELLEEHVSVSNWSAFGELMGKMHRFAGSWRPSPAFEAVRVRSTLVYGSPLVLYEQGRVDLCGLADLLQEAHAVTDQRISALMAEQPNMVIHGDLHPGNVKVGPRGLAPFDFEDPLWGVPVIDVANALFYVRDRTDYVELGRAFRTGYERHRPWVETEPGEVDRLMISRGIDMLNFVALDPTWVIDDWEAYVRRREVPAAVAVGALEPVIL